MTTAGEAAALFGGPVDSANDPFASPLGTESASTELPADGDPFSAHDSASAAALFASSGDADLFSGSLATSGNYYGTYNATESTDYEHSYDPYGAQSSGTPNQHFNQVYPTDQAQYGQVDVYGQQQGTSAHGTYGSSAATDTNYTYDPYAPFGNSNSQPSYGPTTEQQTSYHPYAPAASNALTSVLPSSETSVSHVYDPYKPAISAVHQASPYSVPDYSHPRTISQTVPPPVSTVSGFTADVPPPLPSASAYRPKASNAYDPPLPPPKPKRTPQHHWPHQTTSLAQIPHNGAASRIVSPPPPPRGTTPSSFGSFAPPPSTSPVHPPAHTSQNRYNGNASSSDVLRADMYSPPPVRSLAPAQQVNQYSNGHISNDDAHGPYRPMSPKKPASQHETYTDYGVATRASYNPYPLIPSPDSHHTSYTDELEGGQSSGSTVVPHTTISPSFSDVPVRSGPSSPTSAALFASPAQSPRKVLSRHQSPERTKSPGASSIRSIGSASATRRSIDQPAKKSPFLPHPASYEPPSNNQGSSAMYSHVPAVTDTIRRTTSPSTFGSLSPPLGKEIPTAGAYTPLNGLHSSASSRDRSMSSSSSFSVSSVPPRDPYAPSAHSRQQSSESYKYSSQPQSFHTPPDSGLGASLSASSIYDRSGAQVLSVASRLTHAPYAPSPSLLGSNDPLGRTSVKIPIVSFGFGGKIVTCFHGVSQLETGFDVALSSRQSTDVQIRALHKVIPQSALDNSTASYPGPLFLDPGTPATGLVRTGVAAQTKTKKANVVKYLELRAEEISRGLSYLHRESVEGQRAEAKHVLLLLLKVMVENDGKVSGSAQIDAAVRQALAPSVASQDSSVDTTAPPLLSNVYTSVPSTSYASTTSSHLDLPISVSTLRGTHLDKIQELLIRGERRLAFQFAADERLWAHAMVIASSIDRDAWKEVVKEFVQTELASNASGTGGDKSATSSGRESLRVAYSLFAGQGAASVQQLTPQKLLIDNASSLQVPPVPHTSVASVTPLSPNFPHAIHAIIPAEVLSKWAETAAMIISNPMTTEAYSALTALGDQLLANNWIEAAHVCYMLSPQTSPIGGANNPTARIILVGGPNPMTTPNFWKDLDPIILTEVTEFALSLASPSKGQEVFSGLPHLQAYRLIHAAYLAEVGHVQSAHRYCEAIASSLGRGSPYVHTNLVAELKGLTDRLIATPQLDKSGSWIGSKMTRPSLDKLGGWLEDRLTSFIAGEGDAQTPEKIRDHDRSFSGPFAHFTQISSATSSTVPTPQRSTTDLMEAAAHASTPPYRSGSAMALRPPVSSQFQINRASSAMDYVRRKASPVPRVSSAGAAASFTDSPYQPTMTSVYGHVADATPKAYQGTLDEQLAETNAEAEQDSPAGSDGPQIASWWNDASESGAPTPTVSNFVQAEASQVGSTDGFVSMMDNSAFSVTPISSTRSVNSRSYANGGHDDDDDDLGLSNSVRSKAMERSESSSSAQSTVSDSTASESSKIPEKPAEVKQTTSSGWLSRLWRRNDTPGPVKANLGEQTSFYYDKELKRWVNKTANADNDKPTAPPPPPSRAQTASPGTAAARLPTGPPIARTPPVRPATAMDSSDGQPKPPSMRVRSNLVPPDAPPIPSSPAIPKTTLMDGPPGLNGPPPPSVRAKAQAKRNIRNRYVDVFQQ